MRIPGSQVPQGDTRSGSSVGDLEDRPLDEQPAAPRGSAPRPAAAPRGLQEAGKDTTFEQRDVQDRPITGRTPWDPRRAPRPGSRPGRAAARCAARRARSAPPSRTAMRPAPMGRVRRGRGGSACTCGRIRTSRDRCGRRQFARPAGRPGAAPTIGSSSEKPARSSSEIARAASPRSVAYRAMSIRALSKDGIQREAFVECGLGLQDVPEPFQALPAEPGQGRADPAGGVRLPRFHQGAERNGLLARLRRPSPRTRPPRRRRRRVPGAPRATPCSSLLAPIDLHDRHPVRRTIDCWSTSPRTSRNTLRTDDDGRCLLVGELVGAGDLREPVADAPGAEVESGRRDDVAGSFQSPGVQAARSAAGAARRTP